MPPQAKVHNLVLGRTWVDSYGNFIVTNTATGDKVHLEFKPCGWFGAGQHEFEGHVMDAEVSGDAGVVRFYQQMLIGRHDAHFAQVLLILAVVLCSCAALEVSLAPSPAATIHVWFCMLRA